MKHTVMFLILFLLPWALGYVFQVLLFFESSVKGEQSTARGGITNDLDKNDDLLMTWVIILPKRVGIINIP